ncbi:sensor histidine kinase [Streptomyces sp. NPDC020802]|uniref:sensor histidine kinase n=1 Tax=Streptomyces sp. NPDC020802 TaxID=3365094 RepID=UPI0037A13CC2
MINSVQRLLRDHPRTVDAVMVAVLLACSFPGSMVHLPGSVLDVAWWPGVLLTGIACIALLWRRTRPRTTVVITVVCSMVVTALGYLLTALLLGPLMVALYSLAARSNRRTANTITFTCIALLVATAVLVGPEDEPLVLRTITPSAWLLIPTALGTVNRIRASFLAAEQARADYAERTRENEALLRVTEERMRIARELHDVVAHHLALANAQAGTVAHLLRTRPDEAERIVTDLAGTTSSALRELKATVGLLRHADDAESPTEPTAGLGQLSDLTASFQHAGLTVTVTTEGNPQPLSPGADLTAYRIVQEALTNVTKHAPTAAAEVRLTYSHDLLRITITNDGDNAPPSPPAPGSGYGLIGMRERAQSAGGLIRAGRRPQGGFEVAIELPLHPHTPAEAPVT